MVCGLQGRVTVFLLGGMMLNSHRAWVLASVVLTILTACNARPATGGGASADTCGIANFDTTTPLARFSGEKRIIYAGKEQIEYSDGLNTTIAHPDSDVVLITNYETGYQYISVSLLDKDSRIHNYVGKVPLVSRQRAIEYWEGRASACRLGPCQFNGISGIEWSHPAAKPEQETRACISPEGLLLSVSRGGQPFLTFKSLVRRPIPRTMFDPPAGVQVVTPAEFDQISARTNAEIKAKHDK